MYNFPLSGRKIGKKQPRDSLICVCYSEKAQQLAQAWLHGARWWIEAGAGRHASIYQGAPEQNFRQVDISLNTFLT